jgi:hypothetical protein
MLIQIIIDEEKEQCFEIGQKQELIAVDDRPHHALGADDLFPGVSLHQRLEEIAAGVLAALNE